MMKCMICKKREAMNFTVRDFGCPTCKECMEGYRQLDGALKMFLGYLAK